MTYIEGLTWSFTSVGRADDDSGGHTYTHDWTPYDDDLDFHEVLPAYNSDLAMDVRKIDVFSNMRLER